MHISQRSELCLLLCDNRAASTWRGMVPFMTAFKPQHPSEVVLLK